MDRVLLIKRWQKRNIENFPQLLVSAYFSEHNGTKKLRNRVIFNVLASGNKVIPNFDLRSQL